MKSFIEIQQPTTEPWDWREDSPPPSVSVSIIRGKILAFAEYEHNGHVYTEIYTDGRLFISLESKESFVKKYDGQEDVVAFARGGTS